MAEITRPAGLYDVMNPQARQQGGLPKEWVYSQIRKQAGIAPNAPVTEPTTPGVYLQDPAGTIVPHSATSGFPNVEKYGYKIWKPQVAPVAPAPTQTPLAPAPKAETTPVVPPKATVEAAGAPKQEAPKAMQAPLYDPYAENAMNRRVTEASDLSAQGRSTRSALASRLGALDVSGSSAPFLAPGVINAQLGLEDENAGSFDKQATNVAGAMPSILGGIKEGFTSPQLFEAQKIKSMFEQADPMHQAKIDQMRSEQAKNAPLEVIAKLQQEALSGLKPEERKKYGLATLPNHTPRGENSDEKLFAKIAEGMVSGQIDPESSPQVAAFLRSKNLLK